MARDRKGAVPNLYRGYDELEKTWEVLSERGARLEVVGTSVKGALIRALEVGVAGAERLSVIIAGLHAMEWIGVEVALTVLERLMIDPPRDRRVLCFPLVNVDGFRAVERDLRAGRRRYQRANARGVDLNRNWPTHYSHRHLPSIAMPWLGTSGNRARSEPEVDAVCTRLDAEIEAGTEIDGALSLHSIGRMLLVPYGGKLTSPKAIARLMGAAQSIEAHLPVHYRPIQTSRWWPGLFAHGLEIDHLHDRYGATSVLVECSRGGARLLSPSTWLDPFWWYNPRDPREEVGILAPVLEAFIRGSI